MQPNDLTDESSARRRAGEEASADTRPAPIRVEYRRLDATARLPQGVLAAVRFGVTTLPAQTPPALASRQSPVATSLPLLMIDVRLAPLHGPAAAELWLANGPVRAGRSGMIRYAHDDHFLFAAIEEDERTHGGIRSTSEAVYAAMRRFQQHSRFPHLLRMWNYADAINVGPGDLERYRQFCVGRGRALADAASDRYPAATAIGRHHTTHQLQVFWLAGRQPGTPVENPRQVSAYHYPLAHGPASPSFSRATVAPDGTVLISGTASIVGHVSQHRGNALEQLEETLRNLDALSSQAQKHGGTSAARELLKVYVRDPTFVEPIAARLRQLHPDCEAIFLAADICRRELLLEIECVRRVGNRPGLE